MSSIKEQKEAFVTGHSGSTPLEVLLVCSSAPIGLYLFLELRAVFQCILPSGECPLPCLIFLEGLVILVPMALCQTILLYPYGVIILGWELILATLLNRIRPYLSRYQDTKMESAVYLNENKPIQNAKRILFLTFYRSTISFLTFIAILAVDFPIFPRSFAKTEVQGYGLMDVGAASFCISGGMVSAFAKRKRNHNGIHVLKKSVPLFVMGLIRLITTKGLEYQEHVSEYGVQWNFFFTLAVVSLLSWMIREVFISNKKVNSNNIIMSLMVPSGILILYQRSLSHYGMQKYIENAPRHCELNLDNSMCNFFAANREGILGSIGYLVLYLFGESIGRYCLWDITGNEEKQNTVRGIRTLKVTFLFWSLLLLSTVYLDIPVSRRSMSASFIFWVLAHNMSILLFTWLACSFTYNGKWNHNDNISPPIFQAVNNNGFLVFVLANLMTGAVNLSMDTLNASNMEALIAIFSYLFSVGAVALLLDSNRIVSLMKWKRN